MYASDIFVATKDDVMKMSISMALKVVYYAKFTLHIFLTIICVSVLSKKKKSILYFF